MLKAVLIPAFSAAKWQLFFQLHNDEQVAHFWPLQMGGGLVNPSFTETYLAHFCHLFRFRTSNI
jgi:hypothetical protein